MPRIYTIACVLALATMCAASVRAADSNSAQARRKLDALLPPTVIVDFSNGTSLKNALDFVADVSGVDLHANWKMLDAVGISQETQVTLRVRNVTARKLLKLILDDASGDQLVFYIDDGVVEVTTQAHADAQTFTVVYPVHDLLVVSPHDLPILGGFRQHHGGNAGVNPDRLVDKEAEKLVKVIQATVCPKYWADNKASIKYYGGNLIVSGPRCVHEALGGPID